MKSHELASSLRVLADLLKSGPNVEVHDLGLLDLGSDSSRIRARPAQQKSDLPIALSALLSLSRIDRVEWINLISELGLQIEIRPRDASRDILGKVLRILEREPEARILLNKRVKNKEASGSPELARALSSLLSD